MIYRIHTTKDSEVKEINKVKVGPEPIFVETSKKLDVDKWYEKGVYIKEYDEAPEFDINGKPRKVIKMKG